MTKEYYYTPMKFDKMEIDQSSTLVTLLLKRGATYGCMMLWKQSISVFSQLGFNERFKDVQNNVTVTFVAAITW